VIREPRGLGPPNRNVAPALAAFNIKVVTFLVCFFAPPPRLQETIICGLGYGTPGETLTAYREALRLRPFMDDRFRSEVHEVSSPAIRA